MARAKPSKDKLTTEGTGGAEGEAKAAPSIRKNDLVDRVVAASGIKKKTVKPVVDAVLAELGLILSGGSSAVLPPLGRLQVNRTKEGARANVITLKLRQIKPGTRPAPAADVSPDDETPIEAAE